MIILERKNVVKPRRFTRLRLTFLPAWLSNCG